MDFNQLAQQSLEQTVQKTVEKELEKAIAEIKHLLPSIQIQLRRDMFQNFKMITSIIIEQEFVKVYGHGFDLSSLQHSLIYIQSDKTLDINISYNPNIFRFNDKFYEEQNKFNQNARRWERKNRKYLNPGFYTDSGSFADFYDMSDFNDYLIDDPTLSQDDLMDEIALDYDDMTFNSKRNPMLSKTIDGTYQTAIKKAKQGFNREWNRSIKNKLEKKYGIKLT